MPSEIIQSVIGRMVYKGKKRKNSREKSKSKMTSAIHSSSHDQKKKKKNGKEKSHDDQKKDEGEQKRICTYADRKASSHDQKEAHEKFLHFIDELWGEEKPTCEYSDKMMPIGLEDYCQCCSERV